MLLNNKPLAAGSLCCFNDSWNVLETMSERTELKSCVGFLLALVETDKGIWVAVLLALEIEVLEVDYRRTS